MAAKAFHFPARLMLAAAMLGPVAAFHQASVAAPPPDVLKTSRWIVYWDEDACSLMRAGQDSPQHMKIGYSQIRGQVTVSMGNRQWSAEPSNGAKELDIILLPSGEKMSGPSRSGPAAEGALLVVGDLEEAFLDRLAASRGIAVESKGTRLIEMTFPPARTVVTQLRTCSADLLKDWGIDAATLAVVKRRPVPITSPGAIFAAGYPAEALQKRIEGVVIARFKVTETGIVKNCVAANKDASKLLAAETCRMLTKRLLYQPALGRDGKPTATWETMRVSWRLPDTGRRSSRR